MIPQQVIAQKRDGGELAPEILQTFLEGFTDGRVGEEQMAAFLMAVYFRGLSPRELSTMTDVMLASGAVLDFSDLPGPRVDKHSTGGVGDKVSLVLAPLAAEMGMFVPMMSGRALGHTGGTLDKLESIEGFRTRIPLAQFRKIVETVGCGMIGQTDEIAPLDKRLYALRDVTGTVSSVPLITASIMSKKLAEGLSALVLDVKVGAGAFLPELEDATLLARTMVKVGRERGLPVTALLTAMDRPLGRAVGNALEVGEALECLQGGGPADLRTLSLRLAAEMAVAGGVAGELDEALEKADVALSSGRALERFGRMVEAQGGPGAVGEGHYTPPRAPVVRDVPSVGDGMVREVNPRVLGYGLIELGGGRTRPGQRVDWRVGFEVLVSPGEMVERGRPLARLHCASEADLSLGAAAVSKAIRITEEGGAVTPLPLIIDRIGGPGR